MTKSNKFSPEVRERAVRIIQKHRGEYLSLWATTESIASKVGCVPKTFTEWVKRAEVDAGVRENVMSSEAHRMKELEREVKELRRANEILKLVSGLFAQAELHLVATASDHLWRALSQAAAYPNVDSSG